MAPSAAQETVSLPSGGLLSLPPTRPGARHFSGLPSTRPSFNTHSSRSGSVQRILSAVPAPALSHSADFLWGRPPPIECSPLSEAIPPGPWGVLAFLHGASAWSAELQANRKCVRHEEKVRRLRLDEGYHILGALGLQVGVGIVIESTLGKPLHQRSEILAHYIFVELGKHAALLLEIGRELRVGV